MQDLDDGTQSWVEFADAFARAGRVPVARVACGTRLADLGLDSLALTETIVVLIADFEMSSLAGGLERRDWESVTVGDLYAEYVDGQRAGGATGDSGTR